MPHGLCMFGADGRLAVMNHRFSEMMSLSDDFVQRGASAPDIIAACVAAGSISAASGKMILAEIESTQAPGHDHDRSRHRRATGRCHGHSSRWPAAAPSCCSKTSPSGATREARISHLARYDELTALPNRVNFRDEIGRLLAIQQAPSSCRRCCSSTSTSSSRSTTRWVIPAATSCCARSPTGCARCCGPEDFVARFGGDEFVVFQQNIHSHEDAAGLARRIVERLSERYKIDNHLVEIGASVGIAHDVAPASAPTRCSRTPTWRCIAPRRTAAAPSASSATRWRKPSRRAASWNSTCARRWPTRNSSCSIQPLVNLKSGRISTCEALLRWNHPVRGTVSPIDIIPVAEDMGLIVDLGRWILRKACMECMKWPEAVSVAVNFSPQQFHQRDVLSEVRYALEVSGLPAHRLEIEITESSLLRNTQLTHDVLSQLHALGVRISLDDFGTGYSSLSYLHNFPLQKVKIDRSFLEGIDTDRPLTLLRGVARLSRRSRHVGRGRGHRDQRAARADQRRRHRDRGAGLSVQPAGAGGAGSPVAECLARPPLAGRAAGRGAVAIDRLT